MAKVEHFDIPAENVEQAKAFYEKVFGWTIEQVRDMDYWMIKTDGGIGGGIYKRKMKEQIPIIYTTVDNLDKAVKTVKESGGKVLTPKSAVPGMGWMAVCGDPEGNGFGLWEADKEAK